MNRIKQLLISIILLSQISCNTKSILPGFKMGMKEESWKMMESGFTKDKDSVNLYNWETGDTTLTVKLVLNNDGVKYGNLRIISINLSSEDGINKSARFLDSTGKKIFSFDFVDNTCSKDRFERVLNYLKHSLSKIDSVTYTIRKKHIPKYRDLNDISDGTHEDKKDSKKKPEPVDTIEWRYHFHDRDSKIILRRSIAEMPTNYIPFEHYELAEVHLISNSYEEELASILEVRRKSLTPKTIITVPIYANVNSQFETDNATGFYVMTNVDPNNIISIEEDKAISSIKGRVIIMDKFGDSIYFCSEMKIDFDEPLRIIRKPGLQFVFESQNTTVFQETKTYQYISLESSDVPQKLKRAIAMDEKILAKYIPEAILYSNGTVLK